VQALLPFRRALELMARDMKWTQRLGDAVLAQRGDVMDAVQGMRHAAERYGYLRTNAYYNVANAGAYIESNQSRRVCSSGLRSRCERRGPDLR